MITINRISLKDFGPIEEFSYEFPRTAGTFAVRAPNGTGKSHLALALQATATNQIAPDRPRGSLVRNYGLNGESAKIEVEYRVDGEPLTVARSIAVKGSASPSELADLLGRGAYPEATTRHQAWWRDQRYGKASEIEELVASVFGIDNPVQAGSVFVAQGQAGAIWRGTPAERAKSFLFLSGADRLAEANRYAAKRLEQFRVDDYSEPLAAAEADLARLSGEAEQLRARLDGMKPVDPDVQRATHGALQILRDARRQRDANQAAEKELAGLKSRMEYLRGAIDGIAEQLREVGLTPESARELEQSIQQALVEVRTHEAGQERVRRLNDLNQQFEQLSRQLTALPADDLPEAERLAGEIRDRLAVARAPLAALKRNLDTFGVSGRCPTCGSDGVCPKCGQPSNLKEAAAGWPEELRRGTEAVQRLEADQNAVLARQQAARTVQQTRRRQESELAGLKGAIQASQRDAATVTAEEAALRKQYADQAGQRYARWRELLDRDRQCRQEMTMHLEKATYWAGQIKTLPDLDLGVEREAALEAEISSLNEAVTARAALEGRLQGLTGQAEGAAERVEQLRRRMAEHAKAARAAEFLSGVRAATHPNAIPRDRAAAYVERVNLHLAHYCRELRLPFNLRVDPDQQDLMFGLDELLVPAQHRLSEGQRTMAAWAWTLSLYAIHAGRVGFLVLDEPTVGLDAENRRCVASAMRDLSGFCRQAGMQILMITHDDDLSSAFDVTIRLDGCAA